MPRPGQAGAAAATRPCPARDTPAFRPGHAGAGLTAALTGTPVPAGNLREQKCLAMVKQITGVREAVEFPS